MSSFLYHLWEAVSYGQGGVYEALHAAHETSLRTVVQLRAWAIHTLVPADVSEVVHLELNMNTSHLLSTEKHIDISLLINIRIITFI